MLYIRKISITERDRSQEDIQKGLQECTSTVAVSPDHLSPAPSTSSSFRTPEHTEKDPDDLELADGDIQMQYSSDYLYSSNLGAITGNYLSELTVDQHR